jgi:hypothetical protein
MFISSAQAWRSMEFLEQFDLKDLSYVGMRTDKCGSLKTTYAFFQDPEGFTHTTRRGNYVGLNNGVLTQITDEAVKLKEVVRNSSNEWVERDIVLPRTERKPSRARAGFEEEQALAKSDSSGKVLRRKMVMCRELFSDAKLRLRCFDDVISMLQIQDRASNWICIPPKLD